jgi:hypothetical protein
MGSSGGWKDFFTMGSYGAQRKAARTQAAAAERYAAAQEQTAKAIESSSAAMPGQVKAEQKATQEAAESSVNSAAKRKKTSTSTVNQRFRGLGSGGGKANLGDN